MQTGSILHQRQAKHPYPWVQKALVKKMTLQYKTIYELTVWWFRNPANQLRLVVYPMFQGFILPGWCNTKRYVYAWLYVWNMIQKVCIKSLPAFFDHSNRAGNCNTPEILPLKDLKYNDTIQNLALPDLSNVTRSKLKSLTITAESAITMLTRPVCSQRQCEGRSKGDDR